MAGSMYSLCRFLIDYIYCSIIVGFFIQYTWSVRRFFVDSSYILKIYIRRFFVDFQNLRRIYEESTKNLRTALHYERFVRVRHLATFCTLSVYEEFIYIRRIVVDFQNLRRIYEESIYEESTTTLRRLYEHSVYNLRRIYETSMKNLRIIVVYFQNPRRIYIRRI